MAILRIEGIAMPDPMELTVNSFDLSSSESGRTLAGKMNKDIIARKVTLALKWNTLNWSDTSKLLSAVESKVYLQVTYPDPKLGVYTTKEMYVGDRTSPAITLVNGKEYWQGISFDLIER